MRQVASVHTNIQSWDILDPFLRSQHGVADRCKGGAEGDSSRHLYKTVTRSLSFLAGVTVKSGLVTKMQKSISHGDWIERVPKEHILKLNRMASTVSNVTSCQLLILLPISDGI